MSLRLTHGLQRFRVHRVGGERWQEKGLTRVALNAALGLLYDGLIGMGLMLTQCGNVSKRAVGAKYVIADIEGGGER